MSMPVPMPVPGQQMTADQIQQIQAHMQADAQRLGISMEEYVQQLQQLQARQRAQQQAQQHGHDHEHDHDHDHHDHDGHNHNHNHQAQNGHRQAVQPGPPKPEALAVAHFLRAQQLKPRTCIFQEKRKDMFRVKRAMRALMSPAYEKARRKNVLLPAVTDRASAEATFKLLPLSLLALRVKQTHGHDHGDDDEPGHEGHNHGGKPAKRIKGLWTVEIVQQQEAEEDMYYMWLYEGPQWRQRAYAIGALAGVMTLVMFPLWPLKLRQGAWYLSMGFFGLIVLFFVMAIFRLILFLITMFTHAPGLWLFPNLFEDVGFIESFIPLWAWQEDKKAARKRMRSEKQKKQAAKAEKLAKQNDTSPEAQPTEIKSEGPTTTGTDAKDAGSTQKRVLQASVEEADDE